MREWPALFGSRLEHSLNYQVVAYVSFEIYGQRGSITALVTCEIRCTTVHPWTGERLRQIRFVFGLNIAALSPRPRYPAWALVSFVPRLQQEILKLLIR